MPPVKETRLSGTNRTELAKALGAAIDEACVKRFSEPPRDHLGASVIGKKCERHIQYVWRWMVRENFSGQMFRLFNRGHTEEARVAAWLELIGCKVELVNPETGKQNRMETTGGPAAGHYGGSDDAKITFPPAWNIPHPFLGEFKTHNQKSFDKVKEKGVKFAKYEHYVQMCVYGEYFKLSYALYFAVNKNTDEIYVEVVELDFEIAIAMRQRAGRIVIAPKLLPRIAASANYIDCKFCSAVNVCHNGSPAEVNCRSCAFSQALPNGVWYCDKWRNQIPKAEIPKACGQWSQFQ